MKLSKEARKLSRELFRASFSGGRLDQSKIRLVSQQILTSKPRNTAGILADYTRLVRLELEKHHAIVESAAPLDDGVRQQVEGNLRARHGDLTTEFRVTPDLIGGLRVRIGSDVFDSSVREKLRLLENDFSLA